MGTQARFVTRLVALAVAALFAAASLQASPQFARAQGSPGGRLVVTSWGGSWEKFMRDEILPDFEKESKTKVELSIGLSKDWVANMMSAGVEGAPYDIVMTDEIWASDLRHKGFYASLPMDKVPTLKDLSPVARMQNDEGALFDIEPIGIAYRTDMIKTPPKSWKDLWKPEYKGKLGLYTITNTVGGVFLMLTSKIWGGDPKKVDVGFAKIKELKPFHQSDFSGNMETLLTQGEVPIGILETPAVARLRQKGVKIAYVIPAEGMMMFDEDVSVTKASKNKEAAYAFVNYLLSPRVQEKFMRKFFSTSPNTKVVVPPELRKDIPISGERTKVILRWDYDWYNQHKGDFIKRWNREISG